MAASGTIHDEKVQGSAASLLAPGIVVGGVAVLLRVEGAAAFAAALALYGYAGFSWSIFALCFFAPDLSMLGYLAGLRIGTAFYNVVHTYTLGAALVFAGFFCGLPLVTAAGLILSGHIGFDRGLGFGLKYSSGFGDTHLSRASRRAGL